ncbi:hypothetical protein EPO04_00800 [Patescibacteria group bacterium]|nr:MAG: hypothetical protein EPO04_00800 [Patescibacteria group bacterium]
MARLPTIGSDNGNWGAILNDYLSQELNSDGSLKIRTDGTLSSAVADGSITASKLSPTVNNYLASAQTAVQSVNGKAGTAVTLAAADISGVVPSTQLGAASGVATLDGSSKLTSSQIPATVSTASGGSDGQISVVSGGLFTLKDPSVIDITMPPYNADPTGTTDASAEFQAAINALYSAGGGTIYAPTGTYLFSNTQMSWRTKVSLRGDGPGQTIFKMVGWGGSLIEKGNSYASPMKDCTFSDFEVDGSLIDGRVCSATNGSATITSAGHGLSNGDAVRWASGLAPTNFTALTTAYYVVNKTTDTFQLSATLNGAAINAGSTGGAYKTFTTAKAIYTTYNVRNRYVNLYVHDTTATGLGVDFLVDCAFDRCVVENAGRDSGGSLLGSSGIGIGTGAWDVESTTITDCIIRSSARNGIFFERQATLPNGGGSGGTPYYSRGAIVHGNTIIACKYGIADNGIEGAQIWGNRIEDSTSYGFYVGAGNAGTAGRKGKFFKNIVKNSTSYGIYLDASTTTLSGYEISSNDVYENDIGIKVASSAAVPELIITDNDVRSNERQGMHGGGSGALTDATVIGNRFFNNGTVTTNAGLELTMDLTRCRINRNRAFDNQGVKTQSTGVILSGTNIAGGEIMDNDVIGNSGTGLSITNDTQSGCLVRRNRGATTYRQATATSATMRLNAEVLAVTDTSALRTITLPGASGLPVGSRITVKDESNAAGTNNITIQRAGSDTIDGSTSTTISTNSGSKSFYTDGSTKWFSV